MSNMMKSVLFNDGEGLDYNDMNNVSRYLRAFLMDGVVRSMARMLETDWIDATEPKSSFLFAMGAAVGGGTAGTVGVGPGLIAVAQNDISLLTGNEEDFLAYFIARNEFSSLAVAAPDPTNPRFDVVYAQLALADGNPVTRDSEDAIAIGSGASLEETIALTAGVGALAQPTVSLMAVYAAAGGHVGPLEVVPASVTPATGQVQLSTDRKTFTTFAGDAITSLKVLHIPAYNVAHVKTTTNFNKEHRVTCTIGITTGTPAVSPTIPSSPGHALAILAVKPAGAPYVFGRDLVWDTRIPFGAGYHSKFVPVTGAQYNSGWTMPGSGAFTAVAAGAGNVLHFLCPGPRKSGRVLRVRVYAQITGTGSVQLKRAILNTGINYVVGDIDAGTTGGGPVSFSPYVTTMTNPSGTGAGDEISYMGVETYDFLLGLTNGSATPNLAQPLWGTGHRNMEGDDGTGTPFSALMVQITSGAANDKVMGVEWEIVA